MKLKPATGAQVDDVALALHLLREARKLLMQADAPRSAERARLAIKSTEGAVRHIERRRTHTLKGTP